MNKFSYLFVFLFVTSGIIYSQTSGTTSSGNDHDVPIPVSTKISLAGSSEPDIVRFLNVQDVGWVASLSPDGSQVAYLTRLTGKPQMWITATDRLSAPLQITYGNSVVSHKWSPSGNGILYATDKSGDEKVGFYFISSNGKEETELLPPSDAYRSFGDFNEDGSKFTYSTTERNGLDSDIHVFDMTTKTDKKVFPGKLGYNPISFSPDGESILISEQIGEDANNLFLLKIEDSTLTRLNKPGEPSYYGDIHWKADNTGFYLISNTGKEYNGIAFYSLKEDSLDFLVSKPFDIEQILLSEDEERLHYVANKSGYSRHGIIDISKMAELEAPEWPKGVLRLSQSKDGSTIVARVSSPTIPADLWSSSKGSSKTQRITRSNHAGLDLESMVLPVPHSFTARDGLEIHGLLYAPANMDRNTPLVVDVHGGPTSQSRPGFDPLQQYLIAQGFAIFDLNYRGSTGFGKSYARENNLRKREHELYDLEDAVKYLTKKGIVNPEKVAIMGGSYGGYLTMAAMTRLPEVFECGVTFVGVSNWVSALKNAAPFLKASDRLEYGDVDNPEEEKFFRSISPMTYIDQVRSPVMVLHGVNDPRVPIAESDEFVKRIRRNGGKVEYLRFPDEGHGIRKLENRMTAYVRVAEFLERNLK